MKAVQYKRMQPSGYHVHAFSSAICCYVPDLGVIFGRESNGSFQKAQPFYTMDKVYLNEARLISEGKAADVQAEITGVTVHDLDRDRVQQLITHLRLMTDAREKAETMLNDILPERRRT